MVLADKAPNNVIVFVKEKLNWLISVGVANKQPQKAIKLDFENSLRLALRDFYFKNRRNCHKLCRKKERIDWNKQKQSLYNLRSKDPKELWNKLSMKPKSILNSFSN